MTPLTIKKYLMERKLATLHDIALHFRTSTAATVPILQLWINKGKIRKHNNSLGCRKGCCKCDPETIETYEWLF